MDATTSEAAAIKVPPDVQQFMPEPFEVAGVTWSLVTRAVSHGHADNRFYGLQAQTGQLVAARAVVRGIAGDGYEFLHTERLEPPYVMCYESRSRPRTFIHLVYDPDSDQPAVRWELVVRDRGEQSRYGPWRRHGDATYPDRLDFFHPIREELALEYTRGGVGCRLIL